MPILYLLFGLGLLVLWLIALVQGGVVAWFLWLTFGVALGVMMLAIIQFVWERRQKAS